MHAQLDNAGTIQRISIEGVGCQSTMVQIAIASAVIVLNMQQLTELVQMNLMTRMHSLLRSDDAFNARSTASAGTESGIKSRSEPSTSAESR